MAQRFILATGLVLLLACGAGRAAEPARPQTVSELLALATRLGYVRVPAIAGDLVADERTEDRLLIEMDAYFREAAPGIERDAEGLRRLCRGFARLLAATGGELSEGLCNERLSRYNDQYVPLAAFIDSREFPAAYAATLRDSYAVRLLEETAGGLAVMREVELVGGIPTAGQVLQTRRGDYFRDLVRQHFPGVTALPEAQRLRVYQYLVSINPVFRGMTAGAGRDEAEYREFKVLGGVAFLPSPEFLAALAARP